MINKNWNKVSFRISSLEFSLSEITNTLSKSPTESKEKGQLMSPRNPNSQRMDRNMWILRSGLPDNATLEKHLNNLLAFIESKQKELNILKEKCDLDIFCGLSLKGTQGSFSISSEIIRRISIIPLEVVFDIYVEEK